MGDDVTPSVEVVTFDDLAHELRRLRAEAGSPSYAEIALRVSRLRESAGHPPERARVARTTVYDVFRDGRRRLDVGLVDEVLRALGLDDQEVAAWSARARGVVAAAEPPAPAVLEEPPVVDPAEEATAPVAGRRWQRVARLVAWCVALNLAGRLLVDVLGLPLHLDMTGTAISAVLLGPWWGVVVGLTTNTLGVGLSGLASLSFAVVNVTGALVWGYGVHRFAMGRTIPRFLALNALCALACSCVAAPILLAYGGTVGHSLDTVQPNLLALAKVFVVSVFVSNLLISLVDKTISGFIALAVADARPHDLPPGLMPTTRR